MIPHSIRLGTPWNPGWKAQGGRLGQLVSPVSGGAWETAAVDKGIDVGIGFAFGTVFGSLARLVIPSLNLFKKESRIPFVAGGSAVALIATLIPYKGIGVNALTNVGALLAGIGTSGFIVPPKKNGRKVSARG